MLPIRSGAPCYVPLSASCFYALCDIRHLLLDRSAEPHTFGWVVVTTGGTSSWGAAAAAATTTAATGGLVWGSAGWFGGSSTWGSASAAVGAPVTGWRSRLG